MENKLFYAALRRLRRKRDFRIKMIDIYPFFDHKFNLKIILTNYLRILQILIEDKWDVEEDESDSEGDQSDGHAVIFI